MPSMVSEPPFASVNSRSMSGSPSLVAENLKRKAPSASLIVSFFMVTEYLAALLLNVAR